MLKGAFLSILLEVLECSDNEVLGAALLSPSRESLHLNVFNLNCISKHGVS